MARGSTIAVRVVGDISNLTRDLKQAETKVEKFSSVMAKLRLPVLLAGAASVKMAAQFDTSMSRIVGLVGIAESEVEMMGEAVRELGGETAKSPTELAEALFFVTSAGLRGQEALDALEASAKASAAGLGETAAVADAVTSAMNAYAKSNLSAEESTNILVATVREGKLGAEELASSIGAVLPIASAMGVEFDEVGAAIASMTRLGLNSAESVTALRALFSTIQKPAGSAQVALEGVGLSAEGLRTQLREEGLLAVLTTLKESFAGNTDELTKVIPNVRALTGFLSLTGDAAEATAGIFDRMSDTTGVLDEAFSAAADTIEFRFNASLADLQDAALEIRDPLTRFTGQFLPSLSGALSGTSHEAILVERAINAVRDGIIDASGPVDEFAQAIAFTGGAALGSRESIFRLIESLDVGSESFDQILNNTESFTKAAGLNKRELELLLTVANLLRTREIDPLNAAMAEGADRVLLGYARGMEDVGDETVITTEKIAALSDAMLAAANPAFALIKANEQFTTSQRNYNQAVVDFGVGSVQAIRAAETLLSATGRYNAAQEKFNTELGPEGEQALRDLAAQAGFYSDDLESVLNFLKRIANATSSLPSLPSSGVNTGGKIVFHQGGIVPGIPGENVPILAQAGELVISRDQVRAGRTSNPPTTTETGDVIFHVAGDLDAQAAADIQRTLLRQQLTQWAEVN